MKNESETEDGQLEFDKLLDEVGIKQVKIFTVLNMTKSTWWRKKKDPQTFMLGEIIKIAEVLHMKPVDVVKALIADARTLEKQKNS
jgi:hypothetical protein